MNKETKWHEISSDELESRIFKEQVLHNEPCSKSGAMVLEALDNVLKRLGVEIDGDVKGQCSFLGIEVMSMGEDWPKQVRGITVARTKEKNLMPFAWISEANIERSGDVFCDVQLFESNELLKFHCGVNVTKLEKS